MSKLLNINSFLPISQEVNSLCGELFRNTPISWFGYARFYRNREFMLAMSDAEFQEYYLTNQHHVHEFAHRSFDEIPNGTFFANLLTSTPEETRLHLEVKERFGLDNFIGIFRKNDNYCDIFNFAADMKHTDLPNFYLNNVGMLGKYVDVFYDPLMRILHSSDVSPLMIPEIIKDDANNMLNDHTIKNFSELVANTANSVKSNSSPEIRKANLNMGRLTQRELECLRFIVRGYTSKEIARKLALSFRTVENYCERIKTKLGCRRKQDIIVNYASVFEKAEY